MTIKEKFKYFLVIAWGLIIGRLDYGCEKAFRAYDGDVGTALFKSTLLYTGVTRTGMRALGIYTPPFTAGKIHS